jgi:hypothetical protein
MVAQRRLDTTQHIIGGSLPPDVGEIFLRQQRSDSVAGSQFATHRTPGINGTKP